MNVLQRIICNKARQLRILSYMDYDELDEWILIDNNNEKKIKLPFTVKTNGPEKHVKLVKRINLKKVMYGEPYLFVLGDLDAIVYLNNKPYYGIDRWSRKIPLQYDGDNEPIIELHSATWRVFGEKYTPPIIHKIYLVYIHEELYKLTNKILWLMELADNLEDKDAKQELLDTVWNALQRIPLYTPTPQQLLIASEIEELKDFSVLFDELLRLSSSSPEKLVDAGLYGVDYDELDKYVKDASKSLEEGLAGLRKKYGKHGILHALGHAHIDAAWLWDPLETIWKITRTYAKAIRILNEYHEPVYVFSSALYLEWLRENNREVYEAVKDLFSQGRIIPVGGMWVESDVLITPSESLVRQFLYGQRYFEKTIGERCWIGWLPDSFGYSGSLPQILREAGIELFVLHKTEWNRYNKFPYHLFVWRGIDGSQVLAHVLIDAYNHEATARSLLRVWKKYNEKNLTPRLLYAYGYGDGGGGPNKDMVEKLLFYGREAPFTPKVEHGQVEKLVDEARKHWSELPVWYGEIYVELHRGTYTTNTRIKKYVWRLDYLLRLAEQVSLYDMLRGGEYPKDFFDKAWKTLLLAEFHDILPGTAVFTAYEQVYKDLQETITRVEKIIKDKLAKLAGVDHGYIVYNPLQWNRKELIEIEIDDESFPDVAEYQWIGKNKVLLPVEVPGFSAKTIRLKKTEKKPEKKPGNVNDTPVIVEISRDGSIVIKNKYLQVRINKEGLIESIYDFVAEREVLEKPSNILVVYEDIPHAWDAWDIDDENLRRGTVLKADKVEIVENGPLRARIRMVYKFRRSCFTVDLVMTNYSRRIDFYVKANIRDRRIFVKTWFYPAINSPKAIYETHYGVLERPVHRNTSWDRAKFEVPMLTWMAYEENGYGVALISPVKHGVSVYYNAIGLSLIKTPVYPDPLSDYGEINFMYSFMPYIGTWHTAGVHIEAKKIANPVYVAKSQGGTSVFGEIRPLIKIYKGSLIVETIKKAEDRDTVILRLYEPCNSRGEAVIETSLCIKSAWRTNILEDRLQQLEINDNKVIYKYRPFEIITIEISPEKPDQYPDKNIENS